MSSGWEMLATFVGAGMLTWALWVVAQWVRATEEAEYDRAMMIHPSNFQAPAGLRLVPAPVKPYDWATQGDR